DCDAHHIQPWQHGGTTKLTNLVLLCPHHHNLCEPGDRPEDRRWQVRIGPDGIPEIIPPRFVDRHRQPRRHQRFKTPDG
ncbi:MAG: HNH endonuclease, partial [Propionibacterium sp.]|nr:HNH endonuclease [Propionibacterium sp.]